MLNETTMSSLEALIGMEGGALKEAMESEDSIEVKIPEGRFVNEEDHTVFTKKELLKHDDHLKTTHEQAGREMLVKEFKRENDLEFDGKTIEHLRAFDKENILSEAGKEPSIKIQELEKKNAKLVESNEEWEEKHNSLIETNSRAEAKRGNDTDILGFMKGEYSIPKSDMLTIFNSKHNINRDGESRIISRNGEKLEDGKTFEPLGLQPVVEEFAKQYAKNPEGGSGGGDEGGTGGGGSRAAFDKRMQAEGHNKGGQEYMRQLNAGLDDGTIKL